jgi:enoyl-CoA hydratase/carnithine racemase
MTDGRVRIAVADHVATVTMTRGDKHNALDPAMFEALHEAIATLEVEPGVRAVVLHGDGPSFCSGLDTTSFSKDRGDPFERLVPRLPGRDVNFVQDVATGWTTRVPAPVIAAIQGNCFGGGMQIALGADIRIAAPDARLSVMEVRWGLVPDMGITRTLPPLTSLDRAKEITFSGALLSGTEAAAMGLVTRVADDPLAAAQALAANIAAKSPEAVRSAKRLYETTWRSADDRAALELESRLQAELMDSPNQREAVRAGATKIPGEFIDPV